MRNLLSLLLFAILASAAAGANAANAEAIQSGQIWQGTYDCRKVQNTLKLTIKSAREGPVDFSGRATIDIDAIFAFQNAEAGGSFKLSGQYIPSSGELKLKPTDWIKRPFFYNMVGMAGKVTPQGKEISGEITQYPACRSFQVSLVKQGQVIASANRNTSSKKKSAGDIAFNKDQCRALAAWIKPMRLEFPNTNFKRQTEVAAKDTFKYLFADDHFVPIFGKPIDELSSSKRKSISRAITFKARNCKTYDSPDDHYLQKHSYVWMSRPFGSVSGSGLTFDYVTAFAQERRRILAPLGLSDHNRPTPDQLAELASTNQSIFQVLWPSERAKLVNLQGSQNGGMAGVGIDQPNGVWNGIARCRGKTVNIVIEVKNLPGRIAGVMRGRSRQEFNLLPKGLGLYAIESGGQTIGQEALIQQTSGFGEVFRARSLAGCAGIWATRFDPIDEIGGRYSNAADQETFCSNVVADWIGEGEEQLRLAKRLQADQFPIGSRFDPQRSATAGLFAPNIVDKFVEGIDTLSPEKRKRVVQQISACAVSQKTRSMNKAWDLLFNARSLNSARRLVTTEKYGSAVVVPTDVFSQFLEGRGQPKGIAFDTLSHWQNQYKESPAIATLEGVLNSAAPELSAYPPAEVAKIVKPINSQIVALRKRNRDNALAEEKKTFEDLLDGVSIPYNRIDSTYRGLLESLATGRPVTFDSGSMLFFSGLSAHFMKNCPSNLTTAQRMPIAELVSASVMRAGVGSNYSDTNIGRNMKSAATGQAILAGGQATAATIGCGGSDPLLRVVAKMIKSNTSSEDGGEPVFVRTCAPEHGVAACRCLAKVGTAVYPNIYQRRFSRNIIASIIRKNPLVGMQVVMQCGIQNY